MTNGFYSFLFFTALVTSTFNAIAQDLRVTNPGVMKRLLVLDQGKYGTCYAFTGAFLIDYMRFSADSTLRSRTSPYSVGNSYAKASGTTTAVNGGYVCEGVNSSSKTGRLKALDSSIDDASYDEVGLAFHRFLVTKFMSSYHPIKLGVKFPILTKGQFRNKSLRTLAQDKLVKNFKKTYDEFSLVMSNQYYIPVGYQPSYESAYFALQSAYITHNWPSLSQNFISLIIDKSVSSTVSIPKIRCLNTENKSNFFSKIKSELSNNRPVGISFCSSVISNANYRSNGFSQSSDCRPHAVVIIGHKDFGGEGHFLIRNSWGKSYSHDYRWAFESSGDLWISSRALLNNTYGVHTIIK